MDKLLRVSIAALVIADLLILGLALSTPATGCGAPKPDKPPASARVDRTPGEDPNEDDYITAALLAQGYLRADVPLDYELQDVLRTAAEANGVPYHMALGLIEVESGFEADAVNPVSGCYGLFQLNPDYFPSGLAPAQNIEAGMEYLGSLIARYGDVGAALTACHDGSDTGRRGYADAVLEAARKWSEEDANIDS